MLDSQKSVLLVEEKQRNTEENSGHNEENNALFVIILWPFHQQEKVAFQASVNTINILHLLHIVQVIEFNILNPPVTLWYHISISIFQIKKLILEINSLSSKLC